MTRVFSKVSPEVWSSQRFRDLPDDSAKLFYLYLLSSPHSNSAGCYRLRGAYACDDIGWDPPQYYEALDALVTAQLVEMDEETQEILILRWFKHNPPTNEKHLLGVERLVAKIESAPLRQRAEAELNEAPTHWRTGHRPAAGDVTDIFARPAVRVVAGGR